MAKRARARRRRTSGAALTEFHQALEGAAKAATASGAKLRAALGEDLTRPLASAFDHYVELVGFADLAAAVRPVLAALPRSAEPFAAQWANLAAAFAADPNWQRFAELAGAFERRLAAAVAAHPGIEPAKVRAILFPPDAGSPLGVLVSLRALPALADLERRLQETLAAAETLQDERPANALRTLLASITEKREELDAKARAAKLGARELARRGDRYRPPKQWGLISDRAAALAAYLTRSVPGARGAELGKIRPTDPRPYKKAAHALAAELVNAAYWLELSASHAPPLTAANVKANVQARLRTRRTK